MSLAQTQLDGFLLQQVALDRLDGRYAWWLTQSFPVLRRLAEESREFSTDDLWPRLYGVPEGRAMGALLRIARKQGLCVPTKKTIPSRRPRCHARPIRVWESKIYRGVGL